MDGEAAPDARGGSDFDSGSDSRDGAGAGSRDGAGAGPLDGSSMTTDSSADAPAPSVSLPSIPSWTVLSVAGSTAFDHQQVTVSTPPSLGTDSATLSAGSNLGLRIGRGGAILGVTARGTAVEDATRAFAGGFFLRDVGAGSNWIHPGGVVQGTASMLSQDADVADLGLHFAATYTALADRIAIHAELTDTRGADRAMTVYFALPLAMDGWRWGDDIRRERAVTGRNELTNVSTEWEIGASGGIGLYPWGGLFGPTVGVTIAHGLREPRVSRFVTNPVTRQLYVAFDVGLSQSTTRFPGRAWVDLVLYSVDGPWGFRAATQGYYERFPESFVRRMPPEREGIWMPFTSLSTLPRPAEFGFGVHETGQVADAAFDQGLGVATLRYLSEPWSHWMGVSTPGLDPRNAASYEQVIAYLRNLQQSGSPADRRKAEATLSSGLFDATGRYVFRGYGPGEVPWCGGSAGCALFAVNADPNVSDPAYPINKANLEWTPEAKASYQSAPALDGEFIDNVQYALFRLQLDQRRSHWATARQPTTFAGPTHALGIPSLFATVEYLHWIADEIHATPGRLVMGNTMLEDLPWGADAFDYMGVEIDWLSGGQLVPYPDARLSHRRTISGQRPYGFLMNTDFGAIGAGNGVERYLQTSLFYGIYPSFYSPNASSNPYWQDATFYERDRPLFAKYVPLIRQLNVGGWEPITCARASDPGVYIERFGRWPSLFFTLRNTNASAAAVTITLDACAAIPAQQAILARALVAPASAVTVGGTGAARTLSITVAAGAVEVIRLDPG